MKKIRIILLFFCCSFILKPVSARITWQEVFSFPEKAPLLAVDFIDEMTGIAVSIQGIFIRTFDGGKTWEILNTGHTELLNDVKFVDNQNIWVAGNNGTLLKSDDGGVSFYPVSHPADNTDLYAIDIHKQSKRGIICGDKNLIMWTADLGTTWELKNIAINKFSGALLCNSFFGVVNGENSHFPGYLGYTMDSGKSFSYQPVIPRIEDKPLKSCLTDAFFFDTHDGYLVGKLPNGKGFITNEVVWGENLWNATAFPYGINSLDFSGIDFGVVAGEKGFIAETYNGGLTWEIIDDQQLLKKGETFNDIKLIGNTGFAVTNDGRVYKRIVVEDEETP